MPRPEYIAAVHGAFYDLRTCEASERPEILKRYRAALIEAARLAGCSEGIIEKVIQTDYAAWVKEQGLPRIDRKG